MKRVIVTGGGNGIGREIALTFARKGNKVFIADIDSEGGKNAAGKITDTGGSAFFYRCDLAIPANIVEMIHKAASMLGGIDILINNAATGVHKSPLSLSVEEWDRVININLRAAFLCSREAAPHMDKGAGGLIINIASTRAFMSEPDSEAYAASKGGMVSLTHALAASLAPMSIRVNCISPGWIETGDYSLLKESDHRQHFSGRVGKPSDIANACLFLAENDFINGENLIIDGGMTRKMIYES